MEWGCEHASFSTPAVNKAYKMFDDPEQVEFLKGAVEEAKGLAEQKVKEKQKVAAKQGKTTVEEDDPDKVGSQLVGRIALFCLFTFLIIIFFYFDCAAVQPVVPQHTDKGDC